MLKKLLHEPLVHFLVLGGLFFLFYSFSQNAQENENSIVISQERVAQLTSAWEKKFVRIPTKIEKQKIIDEEIYQLVLYREALKIGLDKNDLDIRKHLVEKMAFVTYDTNEHLVPSDEVLKKFMAENPKKYREEEKVSFTQSFTGVDTAHFKKEYTLTKFEASNIFGEPFTEALFKLKADGKIYKLESTYGVHEVLVTAKPKAEPKTFSLVKEELQNDYLSAQREVQNRALYEKLKSQYKINIEEK